MGILMEPALWDFYGYLMRSLPLRLSWALVGVSSYYYVVILVAITAVGLSPESWAFS